MELEFGLFGSDIFCVEFSIKKEKRKWFDEPEYLHF